MLSARPPVALGSSTPCSTSSSVAAVHHRHRPAVCSSLSGSAASAPRSRSAVGAAAVLVPFPRPAAPSGSLPIGLVSVSDAEGAQLPFSTYDECDPEGPCVPLAMPSPKFAAAAPPPLPPALMGLVSNVGVPVQDLTPDTFHDWMASAGNDVCVIDFYTDFCGPCKVMAPELVKMTTIFKQVRFAKFDVGKHEGAFVTRQGIRRLPTFRVYRNGRVLDELTGARPVELRQLLVHHNRPAFALRSQDNI